jgi:ribonuclease-3
MMRSNFSQLLQEIDIQFHDEGLLRQAFTHSSYVNENRPKKLGNNERLEFLGDAVLELTVSEYLYKLYPDWTEGELTRRRAALVCEPSLFKLAESLRFGSYILLGRGEDQSGGRYRPALLADVFEAFIGALFLDQGIDAVRSFLLRTMFAVLEEVGRSGVEDYKTVLQEFTQRAAFGVVVYRILEERGPAHERVFESEVWIRDVRYGSGQGRSKKEAEQQAARQTILMLRSQGWEID